MKIGKLKTSYQLFIAIVLMLSSCKENVKKSAVQKIEVKPKIEYKVDSFYNTYAQRVAALDTTGFNDIDKESLVLFSNKQSKKITQVIENRLNLLTKWNKDNMSRNQVSDSGFVFYPFSGGDFIHVYYLYPNATEYFMSAIENVGSVLNVEILNKNEFFDYIKDFDTVMRDIYMRSYFITKNMQDDFSRKNKVNGILPILLWSAAKTNHDIIYVKHFIIDSSANKKYIDDVNKSNNKLSIEIKLFNKTTKKIQTLNYYSADLSNNGLRKNSKSLNFLNKYVSNQSNGFIKSASYLMHYDTLFGTIQKLVIEKNKFLVQDDTGIPFKKFDISIWDIELFGKYENPIKDFSESLYQKDLDNAYNSPKYYKGKLNFSLGYHWNSKNQNQIVFIKKQ